MNRSTSVAVTILVVAALFAGCTSNDRIRDEWNGCHITITVEVTNEASQKPEPDYPVTVEIYDAQSASGPIITGMERTKLNGVAVLEFDIDDPGLYETVAMGPSTEGTVTSENRMFDISEANDSYETTLVLVTDLLII